MQSFNADRRFILTTIITITLFGLLMVYEASCMYAFKISGSSVYFFQRQALFFIIGLIFFAWMLIVDMDFIRRHIWEFLIATLILLVIVVLISKKVGGAKRWIQFFGFNFQPSEALKIFFLIFAADYVHRKKEVLHDFRQGLLPLACVLGVICALLLLQPDLGTSVFWIIWTLLFLYLHNANKKHLILTFFLGIAGIIILIKISPYRFRRITAYANPFADPQGAGFQLIQSQIAFGQGGVLGTGFGEGRQKLFFLPAAHTDFIFSIIAEEFGLLGSLSIIGIFYYCLTRMGSMAIRVKDAFRRSVLWGIIFIFFLEISINTGVSCGLFPTKGLPFPFLSYGGSNLVIHYALLGLFFNATRENKGLIE